MWKAIKIVLLILMLCLFSIPLWGCNDSAEVDVFCKKCGQENCVCSVEILDIEDLDSEFIPQIKQDYIDYLAYFKDVSVDEDDISIVGYYGIYSGHYDTTSIAIKFNVSDMDYLQAKHEFLIGAIGEKTRFVYPDSNAIMIWCIPHISNLTQWNIHRMQTAFGYGYLTSSEVRTIGALHEHESLDYYKNNRFDIELEKQIKKDYYYNFGMDKTWTNNGVVYYYTYDDVYILKYCGECSSGAVVLMMTASGFGYIDVENSETVEDITFNYSSSNKMLVWHEGSFYRLSDTKTRDYEIIDGENVYGEWQTIPGAYTLGLITYEELLITQALFNA